MDGGLYGKKERFGKEVPKMSLHSFTHVALRVDCLRVAEAYYCTLLGLEVAWQEAETPDGWATLPDWADWDDAEQAGIHLGLVMLHRDGLRLALEAAETVAQDGRLSHLGVFVVKQEFTRLRDATPPVSTASTRRGEHRCPGTHTDD
jgi:catechol 2,3-dioxygenase-like lactoylglutathione lyase family enzyme